MGKIATLVYHCSKCDDYFNQPGNCPVCSAFPYLLQQQLLEEAVVINAYELRQLIKKMATPEGVALLLTKFKEWLEQ